MQVGFVGDDPELAVTGGHLGFGRTPHGKKPGLHSVTDQILDGGDFQAVLLGENFQIRHSGHGAVIFQDFADDRRRL